MLSPRPKSIDPVDKLDPELPFSRMSVESYGFEAEKRSDLAGLLEDMNHVKVMKPIKARTTVNVRCWRRAIVDCVCVVRRPIVFVS